MKRIRAIKDSRRIIDERVRDAREQVFVRYIARNARQM
jgi:hypothetical protein